MPPTLAENGNKFFCEYMRPDVDCADLAVHIKKRWQEVGWDRCLRVHRRVDLAVQRASSPGWGTCEYSGTRPSRFWFSLLIPRSRCPSLA